MGKICYVSKAFRPAALDIIAKANRVIAEYQRQGFKLTLRQIYYVFVSRDLLPDSWIDEAYNCKHRLPPDTKNTIRSYKHLGDIIDDSRLAGLIDWLAIEDRTRFLQTYSSWDTPHDIVRACASQYTVDLWEHQDYHVECWIEKKALEGIIEPICTELQVSYFSCIGYTSQSAMWEAGQRLRRYEADGKETVIIHLGDHDPSGLDMTRDIRDRLGLFKSDVTIERIALTWDQIQEYGPPPNPAKTTDARYRKYRDEFGDDSYELDALEPPVMAALIKKAVEGYINPAVWDEAAERQAEGRRQLNLVSQRWDEVVDFLGDEDE